MDMTELDFFYPNACRALPRCGVLNRGQTSFAFEYKRNLLFMENALQSIIPIFNEDNACIQVPNILSKYEDYNSNQRLNDYDLMAHVKMH